MYGGAAVVAANLVSGYTDNFELLRMVRTIAGFGGGMVAAAGTAAAASSLNPQRVFAIATVTWGLMSALQQLVTPYVTVPYGAEGGYYAMAAATLLCMLLCGWLLPPREVENQAEATGLDLSGHPLNLGLFARMAERLGVRDAPNRGFAITAMVGVFIYEVGQGAVFPFIEQIGLRTGLEEIAIGKVLGASNFCGLLGGALAIWMGNRFGILRPLVIAISINAVAAFGLTLGENSSVYVFLNFLWNAAFYFVTPYLLAALADMDDRGRWVVAMDAFWWLGDAPGPLLGGWLIESGGYGSLSAVPLVTGGVCVVSFVWVLRSFNSRHKQPSQP
jgi:predicted MFS family arabinose efflux permease